eukprot:c43085_g1_i1 orf=153-326(+)
MQDDSHNKSSVVGSQEELIRYLVLTATLLYYVYLSIVEILFTLLSGQIFSARPNQGS